MHGRLGVRRCVGEGRALMFARLLGCFGAGRAGSSTPKPFLYKGPIAAIRALWAEGGIRPFYAGLVPRGLRMTMAVFILTVAGQRLEVLFL